MGTVSTLCPPPSQSGTPPLPSDVEDHAHTPVHPSHSPNITPLHFHADLVVSPSNCHVHSFLRPPSLHSGIPQNDVVLCSSILDSSLVVNDEQPTEGVGVAKPTCIVIHEEYEWEFGHQHSMKDDSLQSEPPPFFPNLFSETAIHDFSCVSSSIDAPIIDH